MSKNLISLCEMQENLPEKQLPVGVAFRVLSVEGKKL
jgi:hypothetical protein